MVTGAVVGNEVVDIGDNVGLLVGDNVAYAQTFVALYAHDEFHLILQHFGSDEHTCC